MSPAPATVRANLHWRVQVLLHKKGHTREAVSVDSVLSGSLANRDLLISIMDSERGWDWYNYYLATLQDNVRKRASIDIPVDSLKL